MVRPATTWTQNPYGRVSPPSCPRPSTNRKSPTKSVTHALQFPPLETTSVKKYQPSPASTSMKSGNLKMTRSMSAAARTRSWSNSRPRWNPPSGLSCGSHPNQEKKAPTITANKPRPTKPNNPATTRRPRPSSENANTSAINPEEHRPAGEGALAVVVGDDGQPRRRRDQRHERTGVGEERPGRPACPVTTTRRSCHRCRTHPKSSTIDGDRQESLRTERAKRSPAIQPACFRNRATLGTRAPPGSDVGDARPGGRAPRGRAIRRRPEAFERAVPTALEPQRSASVTARAAALERARRRRCRPSPHRGRRRRGRRSRRR